MSRNPLAQLGQVGQSVWYDQMQRSLVGEGTLARMIEEDDLRGLTSNPTIFEKAIAGSSDYAPQLRELALAGKSSDEIYDAIVLHDIGLAADVFRPVWDRTEGVDGFVSLEVSPALAHETEKTIADGRRYFAALGRPNVMIKVPATPEGIPAIEELIAAGVNVNVTLIFSQEVYAEVMEAYIRGLERRAEKDESIDRIASVASFFVSRIDSLVDKQIDAKIASTSDGASRETLESLKGKVAIANAKLANQLFENTFATQRFAALRARGARVQRPLWASTGTKNAKYSDVLYIESLIARDSVNTIPPATYDAFRDHGTVRGLTIEEGVDDAKAQLEALEANGVSLLEATRQLTREGVKLFADSFVSLMQTIEMRRDAIAEDLAGRHIAALGALEPAVKETLGRVEKDKLVGRIWSKDASIWKSEPEHQKIISNALGWLAVVEWMQPRVPELVSFAESVRSSFDDVVVLGMGGSSLCPEVLRRSFGEVEGWPRLNVLDSTVPGAVAALEVKLDLARTLFIVASKSGTTTEPQMFYRYFFDRMKSIKGEEAGRNFVAITDPDTQLHGEAQRDRFLKIFVNPADIGGRYSALSYFGMVPAALSGIDVKTLLDRALHVSHACMSNKAAENPALQLGVTMGAAALAGRDKLTLITTPPIDSVGLWIEQLIAESTGKEGKGIVPVAAEPIQSAASYGNDRIFVWLHTTTADDATTRARIDELTAAGHPVVERRLRDTLDLGAEFFIWELATAVAGAILGINPFDQPNVQESKDNTRQLLDEFRSKGTFSEPSVLVEDDGLRLHGDPDVVKGADSASAVLSNLFASIDKGDYVALLEYIPESRAHDELIGEIRNAILEKTGSATTTGYGPRFLHSTGQLHKGGGANGVFLQITADVAKDVALPEESFGFGTLAQAQALGDFASLTSRKRRAVRVHLGGDTEQSLRKLLATVKQALK